MAELYNMAVHNNAWIASGALNADSYHYVTGGLHYKTAILSWQWAGTSTPNGVFYVEGNNQTGASTETWTKLFFETNKVYGTTFTHSGTSITVNSASAGTCLVVIENAPPYLRLFWDSTSGGAATGLTAGQYTLRPV